MWKKANQIAGVSTGSVVELKAVLAREQQNVKLGVKAKPVVRDKFVVSNPGVAERNRRDEEQWRKEIKTEVDVQAKLQEKSALYEKFVRGELLEDPNAAHADDILVDFERKKWSSDEQSDEPQFFHPDIQREQQRRKWEMQVEEEAKREAEEAAKAEEKRQILAQLIEDTKIGREKHRQLLLKRKQAQIARLEQLKQKAKASKEQSADNPTESSEEQTPDTDNSSAPKNTLRLKRPKLNEGDTPRSVKL